MQIFNIKRGDTSPGLRYALEPQTVNLVGASVRFKMQRRGGGTVIDRAATVFSTTPPVVEMAWQPGDSSLSGWYEAEFPVTFADGSVETFPNLGFIDVYMNPNIPDIP